LTVVDNDDFLTSLPTEPNPPAFVNEGLPVAFGGIV